MRRKARKILSTYRTALSLEGIAIAGIAALIATVTGPFGTYSAMGFGGRFAYWGLISVVSVLLGIAGFKIARMIGHERDSARYTFVGSMFATGGITAAVWGLTRFGFGHVLQPPPIWFLFANVFLIVAGVGIILQLTRRPARQGTDQTFQPDPISGNCATPPGANSAPETPGPRLARRLPEGGEGTILHLSVCDHHVDIHTENGTTSVRMRLGDATEAMDGVEGMR
ncbi:MAG: hypothetical protein OQK00_10175, partial [Rhodobacteraceae bacterium]|nr:hypothetical protein [Paracoccaceae bacterium]